MIEKLVNNWFSIWESGDFTKLPLTEGFTHTSPYGTIRGKKAYLELAGSNKEMFLGNTFEIHDGLYGVNNACIRYTMHSATGSLNVAEWFYVNNHLIDKIVSYYNLKEEVEAGRGISINSNV